VSAVALPDRLASQPTADAVPPSLEGRWRTPLRLAVAALFLAVIVVVLVGQWRQARPLLGRDAVDEYRWLALVLPLFALALTPPLLNRAVAVALRAIRRPPRPAPLSLTGVLRVAGWAVLSWLCYGAHVYLRAWSLGTDGGALLWLQGTGAFAAAFASGPLLLVMPAGAGCARPPCCCSAPRSRCRRRPWSRSPRGCCSAVVTWPGAPSL
jgi:hypothetical protein